MAEAGSELEEGYQAKEILEFCQIIRSVVLSLLVAGSGAGGGPPSSSAFTL